MAAKFKVKIRKARFSVGAFSAQVMLSIGNAVNADIGRRLDGGLDVEDRVAPPLKSRVNSPNNSAGVQIALRVFQDRGYKGRKLKKGLNPIRDWRFTGRTRRAMRVLTVGPGLAILGFSDPEAAKRAAINNRRWRQYGMSPANKKVFLAQVTMFSRNAVTAVSKAA
jgi:hypothetical protein